MAPLSGKQHREYLKMQAQEAREGTKMEREESRKEQLHEIKLQEAAGGANQKLGHKEQMHQAKMQEQSAPLGARKQSPVEGQAGPTDTVPAMLTPGEAVIPRSAAQDPRNKEDIQRMVSEGRDGYANGTVQVPNNLAKFPKVGPRPHQRGYAEGTTDVRGAGVDKLPWEKLNPAEKEMAAQVADLPYSPPTEADREAISKEMLLHKPGTENYTVLSDELKKIGSVPPVAANQTNSSSWLDNTLNRIAGQGEYTNKPQVALPSPPVPADFSTTVGGAATGNRNIANQAARSISRRQAVASGDYPAAEGQIPTPAESAQANVSKSPLVPLQVSDVNRPPFGVDNPVEELPIYNAAKDSQAASVAQSESKNIEALKNTALKTGDPKGFLEQGISAIFGDKGLFNSKELARFAVVAAGGMLSGSTVGGSMRFAAKDVLQAVDRRSVEDRGDQRAKMTQDAAEHKAMINNLMIQGYSMDGINKFLAGGGKDASLLGERQTTRLATGETKKYVITQPGPNQGREVTLTKEQIKTGKNPGGFEWTYNGHALAGDKLGGMNVTEYDKSIHSPEGKVAHMDTLSKGVRETAEDVYKSVGGELYKGKPNPELMGLPTASKIQQQTIAFMKSRNFDPSDPIQRNSIKGIAQVAMDDMMLNRKANAKDAVISFEPFLAKAMLVGRSGVPSTAFDLGTGKPMNPGKIMDLDNAVKAYVSKTGNPANSSDLDQQKNKQLKDMYETYTGNKSLMQKYSNEGTAETGFFRYVMGNLK